MTDDEKQFDKFIASIRFDDAPMPEHRDRLAKELFFALAKQPRRRKSAEIWRMIMKNRTAKAAAAAIVTVAVLTGIYQIVSMESMAFADVIRPILTARTATYTVSIKTQDGQASSFELMWMEPHYARQQMPMGVTIIGDLEKGKVLVLLPDKKEAMVTDVSGAENRLSFSELRQLLRDAQDGKDLSPEYVGKQRIDGRDAVGYRLAADRLPLTMPVTIWADAETLLPIQMECQLSTGADGKQSTATLTNFQFDVELDPSLFSLDVPDGYTLVERFEPTRAGVAP